MNRDLSEHREAAVLENIKFLLGTCNMHPDLVAKRLGISRDTLDKKIERSRRAQPHPDTLAETGEGQGTGSVPEVRESSA